MHSMRREGTFFKVARGGPIKITFALGNYGINIAPFSGQAVQRSGSAAAERGPLHAVVSPACTFEELPLTGTGAQQ
jgi:hypothetical protein